MGKLVEMPGVERPELPTIEELERALRDVLKRFIGVIGCLAEQPTPETCGLLLEAVNVTAGALELAGKTFTKAGFKVFVAEE